MGRLAIKEKKKIYIRNAEPGEMEKIAGLVRDAYQQYERTLSEQAWRFYRSAISGAGTLDGSQVIIAEYNGKLAGTVSLYLEMPLSAKETWPGKWAGIRLLAVHPGYRGHGIGHALVEECINRCSRHGSPAIALHSTREMIVARHIYERAGFKRIPEYDFQPLPDVSIMAYTLDIKNFLEH